MAKNRQIWPKIPENPKKIVEKTGFSIDFAQPQAAWLRTTGYPDPHEYRGFVHHVASVALPHAVREMRRKPRQQNRPQRDRLEGETRMATGLTKTALIRHLADKLQITNKQAAASLDLLAETAIKETKKNGVFVIPGIGRLVKAERKARIGRNPQTGEAIKIKAKTVVKFRVAKAAKDIIAPPKK
jgi:DNA-binding protein HU-beta